MAAPLALARLAVTLAQPSRDGANERLHLLDLPAFEARKRRVAQDFVAEVFRLLAPVEQQRLIDHVPDAFAQSFQCCREPFGFRGIGGRQAVQVVAKALNAEQIEDSCREDSALGKIPDLGKRGAIRRIRHRSRDRVALPRHQHLRELAELGRRRAGVARLALIFRIRPRAFGRIFRRGLLVLHLRLAEEQVEARSQRLLFVLALGERQQQRVAQNISVGKPDIGDRLHGIDAFGGRYPNPGSTSRPEETMQVLAHQPNTPCRPALATKVVTWGIVVSMSASYFNSTLSVSLTVSWSSSADCSSTSTRAQSIVSLTEGSFFRSSART